MTPKSTNKLARPKTPESPSLGARASCPRRGQDALAPESPESSGVRPSAPHHRTRLPHFEAGPLPQHICFRLADSLPQSLLQRLEHELQRLPEKERQDARRRHVEKVLDQGRGGCLLSRPEVAVLTRGALRHFDGDRYHLHGWVVMPNHVHALATLRGDNTLSGVVHSWKSYTALWGNAVLRRGGAFWSVDYFDRVARDEEHFAAALDYIHWNPVNAGLCAEPGDWQWSSYREKAAQKDSLGGSGILPTSP